MANTKPGADSEGNHYVTYKHALAGIAGSIPLFLAGVWAVISSQVGQLERSQERSHAQTMEEVRYLRDAVMSSIRTAAVKQTNNQQVVLGDQRIDTIRQKEWISSTELAAIEGVNRDTIYRRRDEGRYVWRIEHGQYCFLNPQYPTTSPTSMVQARNGHDSGTEN